MSLSYLMQSVLWTLNWIFFGLAIRALIDRNAQGETPWRY